jgi:hypothetical protein
VNSKPDDLPTFLKMKRKTCWLLIDKSRGTYPSYNDYKLYWDSKIGFFRRINFLYEDKRKELKLKKDTYTWIVNQFKHKK